MARGEVSALDIGGACTGEGQCVRIPVDNTNIYAQQVTPRIPLFDHLSIVPLVRGPFACWWSSASGVGRHMSVDAEECFPMPTPAIRQEWRRGVLVCFTLFYLLPKGYGGLRFVLSEPASHPQARCTLD